MSIFTVVVICRFNFLSVSFFPLTVYTQLTKRFVQVSYLFTVKVVKNVFCLFFLLLVVHVLFIDVVIFTFLHFCWAAWQIRIAGMHSRLFCVRSFYVAKPNGCFILLKTPENFLISRFQVRYHVIISTTIHLILIILHSVQCFAIYSLTFSFDGNFIWTFVTLLRQSNGNQHRRNEK